MTVTTLRSINNASYYQGSWQNQAAAADLEGPVRDDTDATYIVGTAGFPVAGYKALLRIADLSSVASNQRIMRCRMRIRAGRSSTSGGAHKGAFNLEDSRTGRQVSALGVYATSTTPSVFTTGWWTVDADGKEWNRLAVNFAVFRCVSYKSATGASQFLRVHELYLDVDIHTQVTVSGVTLTGTDTATPSIGWTYNTNADGDPQRSYQAKVFTLDQVNTVGFNPASTAPVWDSGEVRSNSFSTEITTSLVNGVTYRAYVRAASDFNKTDWWTAYAASSNFTIAFTPPPKPVLTVTPDNTVPHLRNHLRVETKLNMLQPDDASFEQSLGSWSAAANCAVVQSGTQFLHGAQSMRMTATAGGDMSAATAGGVFGYPVSGSVQYTLLASFRAAVTARTVRIRGEWKDNAGNVISTSTGSATDSTSTWTQAAVTATSPVNASMVRIYVEVVGAAAAEQHYVDQVSLASGASTSWVPGYQQTDVLGLDRADNTVIEYLDFHISPGESTNIMDPNIATGGEAYGSPSGGFLKRSDKDYLLLDRSGVAFEGEACTRWVVGESVGSVLDIGTRLGDYSWQETPTGTLPAVPGATYTLSMYVRAATGSHSLALGLVSIDETGATVGSATQGSTVSVGTDWTRLTVTHVAPAGTVGMRGELRNLNGDLAHYLLDAGQFEEGSSATSWRRPNFLITGWRPVRGALTALRTSGRDGVAAVYDREAPPGVVRLYRAWTQTSADGMTLRSEDSNWVTARLNVPGPPIWILKDPQQPRWDLQIHVNQVSENIDEDLTEAHPVRPNDRDPYGKRPLIASDWISGKNGQMSITLLTNEDWFALQALLHTPRTLLLQFPEGGQRYIRLRSRSWTRTTPRAAAMHRIVAEFTEVSRPPVAA